MPGSVEWVPDAAGVIVDLPVFGSEHPMREVTETVAFGGEWDRGRRDGVRQMFDDMAESWTASHEGAERVAPILDALDRGGLTSSTVVELGAGSGVATRQLEPRFDSVFALDLSMKMLAQQSPGTVSIQGDASALPFADASLDLLVLVNMLLFPAEVDRVLSRSGGLLWINTMGPETPIYLPPEDLVEALPGRWTATASRAGSGTWAAVKRV